MMRYPSSLVALAFIVSAVFPFPFNVPGNISVKRAPGQGYDQGISWTSGEAPIVGLDNDVWFFFHPDGNFVVYNTATSTVLWNSGVTGHACDNGACELVFQSDGNLVAYDGNSPRRAIWSTMTGTNAGHEVPATGLFFRNTSPYLQLYSGSLVNMFSTFGANGIVVQNPDPNDPLQDNGQPTPNYCRGATVNCAVCFQSCDGVTLGQTTIWGSNAKVFGDTDTLGTGPADTPSPPQPPGPPDPPGNPCDDGTCQPDPCSDGSCDPDPCDDGSCCGADSC